MFKKKKKPGTRGKGLIVVLCISILSGGLVPVLAEYKNGVDEHNIVKRSAWDYKQYKITSAEVKNIQYYGIYINVMELGIEGEDTKIAYPLENVEVSKGNSSKIHIRERKKDKYWDVSYKVGDKVSIELVDDMYKRVNGEYKEQTNKTIKEHKENKLLSGKLHGDIGYLLEDDYKEKGR